MLLTACIIFALIMSLPAINAAHAQLAIVKQQRNYDSELQRDKFARGKLHEEK
jgi:uncharacterized membrane protein